MPIRKPFTGRRLALNISRVAASIERKAIGGDLSTEEELRYLATMAQLLPGLGRLMEAVNVEKRLDEIEGTLNNNHKPVQRP